MMSLGNSHAQTYLLPGPVRAMEALQNICKVSRQCLVRGQCVNAAMQMQNNAKTHTSGRCLMACDLSSTAACFCGGDLNRVGVSSCPSVGEHMRDAKITMHHATHLVLSFPSAVNHLVREMGTLASIREVGRQCLVRGTVW